MKTKELAINKWSSILTSFGLDAKHLTGKHTSCPLCGGTDRFRFDDLSGRGTYYCNRCGAGDGFDLLKQYKNWSFRKAAFEIDRIISNLVDNPEKNDNTDAQKLSRLRNQRARMEPIVEGDAVSQYLLNRGISMTTIEQVTSSLQLIRELEYWKDKKLLGKFDSMVALIKVDDELRSHHITFLDSGQKTTLTPSRKIMPTLKTISGGAVQLFEHNGVLGVAEGIETALAATEIHKIPTWAALSSNGIKSFEIPEGVSELHIFPDNDQSYVGQNAATTLAQTAFKSGIKTRIHIPTRIGSDWNDELIVKITEAKS